MLTETAELFNATYFQLVGIKVSRCVLLWQSILALEAENGADDDKFVFRSSFSYHMFLIIDFSGIFWQAMLIQWKCQEQEKIHIIFNA